ncbi:hypothetical protein BSPCLSOX_2880, partial [uncultured Gammaproteobacteria bacterium]
LSQHEGGECLDDVVHIAKDKALRLVTNQQVPTPQAIGTWLRRLGKDNQGIKALRKANKTLLKATLNNCKNITLDIDASEVIANKADAQWTCRDLCINRSNHQKPTFHPLGDFLNPALALLGQGLKKSPIGQKLDFANHHLFMQRSHDNKKIKKPHNRGSVNEISRPICTYYL